MWIEMIVLKGMYLTQMSRPVRALWIEMTYPRYRENRPLSRPARALWIEMVSETSTVRPDKSSRPVRALWIEMLVPYPDSRQACVEAREGLVD